MHDIFAVSLSTGTQNRQESHRDVCYADSTEILDILAHDFAAALPCAPLQTIKSRLTSLNTSLNLLFSFS